MNDTTWNKFLDNLSSNICLIVGVYLFGVNLLYDFDQISNTFLYLNVIYLILLFVIRYRAYNTEKGDLLHILLFYLLILGATILLNEFAYLILLLQLLGIFLFLRVFNNFFIVIVSLAVLVVDFYYFKDIVGSKFLKAYIINYILIFYIAYYLRDVFSKLCLKVEELSITDGLTGLLNQKGFLKKLEDEYYRSMRYKKSFCLIMLDSDDLKKINDSYGHKYGNMVIKLIADIVKDSCRRTDFAGRYGGDEYMICLVETDVHSAYEFSERLRKMIEVKSLFTDKGKDFKITVSIGIAGFPESGDKLYEIVENADRALYMAKNDGKNRVKYVVKN
ncbi:GGDEF domain-containing protein [Deferribacteraceae bacterium V6Fe1]|nr:GGDEF domain-containing protein [Deferribacteraceae bacterium V6Fe1]